MTNSFLRIDNKDNDTLINIAYELSHQPVMTDDQRQLFNEIKEELKRRGVRDV